MVENDKFVKWKDMSANTWKIVGTMAILIAGGWTLFAWHHADAKADRKEIVRSIEKLETKETLQEQHAMTMWADEDVIIDGSILEQRADNFSDWRQSGGFHWIDNFEIHSSTVEQDGGTMGLRVECTINGQNLTMMVKDGQPIRWTT